MDSIKPLLDFKINSSSQKIIPRLESKVSILTQTSSLAFNNLLSAINMTAQAKMLSTWDIRSAGSGALTSSFQTVFLSAFVGCLLSIGIEMGTPMGEAKVEFNKYDKNNNYEIDEEKVLECYQKAGDIAKTGWILSFGFGLCTTGLMCASVPLFTVLADPPTAKAAGQFFFGTAIGAVPAVMARTIPQISLQVGDWKIPIVSAVMLYIPSIGLGYLLGFSAGMGPFGIGLGNSIVAWVSYGVLHASFLRPHYEPLKLFQISLKGLCGKMSLLMKKGWELGLQRFSEWGNLAIITAIIGTISSNSLAETNPTIQYNTVITLGMQGLGQGSGMLIKRNTATIEKSLKEKDTELSLSTYQDNKRVLLRNNMLGLALSGTLAISFYIAREPLCNLFLNENADQETREEAQKVLTIAGVGLLADTPRTICLGALRGWKEVLYPTLSSLFMMTAIGVPVAYGLTKVWENVDETFFMVRDLSMLCAAVLAAKQCHMQLKKQKQKIDTVLNPNNETKTVTQLHLLAQKPDLQQQIPQPQNRFLTSVSKLFGFV